jgi:hypothetical protein
MVRTQGTAQLGPRWPSMARPRAPAPSGSDEQRRFDSGDGGGRRRTEKMQREARKLLEALARARGAWRVGAPGGMELRPASMADGLGTGEPGSNVLAAHAGQRRRVLQSHRVGEGGTREGAAMVQRSCPPAMAGAAEHSGHASAVRVGKAKASEGEDAGVDGECLGQLGILNGAAEAL